MMKLRNTIYYVLCLMMSASTLTGCVEEYEADIAEEDANLLVVEGTICSGQTNKFYLSRTQPISNVYAPYWVNDAKVSVRGTDGSENPATKNYDFEVFEESNGYYACQLGNLNPDVEYYLHIEVDDEVYESEPQKPLRSEKIAKVEGVYDKSGWNIDVLVTPAEPDNTDETHYYSWTCDETWEVRPEYITNWYYDILTGTARQIHKLYPTIGWKDESSTETMIGASTNYDNQHIQRLKLYDISVSNERMFYRYSGLIHQRAISKGEYEYELARRQAGYGMGGLFTPQPSALPTNIHCLTSGKRALGYVGCSLNTGDYRFFLNASDYGLQHNIKDNRVYLENPTTDQCLRLVNTGYGLCEWDQTPDGKVNSIWALMYQIDIRRRGAYVEEPYFWSWTENVSF